MAGDHERAAELLGRALDGDPPVQRAEARLRRAEALARLGRADEADAEIRAATLEPIRAAHRPGRARRPDGVRAGASARARAATHALAERRLHEAETPLAPARGRGRRVGREHLASLVDLGRPPVTGVVDPPRELERDRRGAAEAMPTFDDSATTAAPVEEVWKLLYDPARIVEWWEGIERVEPSRRLREHHDLPRGLSRLPDAAGAARRRLTAAA